MKIDLTNPAIRFLVGGANLADGCSVIRNALLRSILAVGAAAVGVGVAIVVAFVLIGTVLYAMAPWFGQINIGLSLSYLGNAWWAECLRAGAVAGVVTLIVSTAGGLGVLGVLLIKRLSRRLSYASSGLSERIRELPPVKALTFIGSAAYNVAHQICPKVELKLDVEAASPIDRIMNDPTIRVRMLDSYHSDRVMRVVKIIPTVGYIRVNLAQEDEPDNTDFFFYNLKSHQFSEDVLIVGEESAESDEAAVELPIEEMMVDAP